MIAVTPFSPAQEADKLVNLAFRSFKEPLGVHGKARASFVKEAKSLSYEQLKQTVEAHWRLQLLPSPNDRQPVLVVNVDGGSEGVPVNNPAGSCEDGKS
jgi:hypothetical protein